MWIWVLFPLILSGDSFPGLGSFLRSCTYTWGRPSDCSRVLSLHTCPKNSGHLGVSWLSAPSPQINEYAGNFLGSPFLLLPGNSLRTLSWGKHRAYVVYFLSLRNYCPVLPDIHFFENHYFIYFIHFLVVVSKRINPVSDTPLSQKWNSSILDLYSL